MFENQKSNIKWHMQNAECRMDNVLVANPNNVNLC